MTNPNDPAFQHINTEGLTGNWSFGLTKREYFAAMAMQGILSNSVLLKWLDGQADNFLKIDTKIASANFAIQNADALIQEFNK